MTAKAAADATAKAARSAAQALLDKGADVIGKNAPDVDTWLAGAKDTLDKIANDPDYGTKLADELNKKIENTDWEQKGTDAANNINEKLEKLNETLEETDWEQKGRDAADFLNKFLGAD
jgi:vacuolar-type H+-ATPase subunit E/Vma4